MAIGPLLGAIATPGEVSLDPLREEAPRRAYGQVAA